MGGKLHMKKLQRTALWGLVLLCLCGVLCAGTSTAEEQDSVTYVAVAEVTTEKGSLNLRKKPASNATILARIPNHTLLKVIAMEDAYWQVEYNGTTGYVASSFVTKTDYTVDTMEYRELSRNQYGDEVLAMKQRLLELGYYRTGSNFSNIYNSTCVQRVKMFQRQNGLQEDGIATIATLVALYASSAVVNAEDLPKPATSGYFIASSSSSDDSSSSDAGDDDYMQWIADHPGVCPCCQGAGCACCNYTGKI